MPSTNAAWKPKGDAWIQFKPGYYLYAILFLIFDVEAIFLLPFAVSFSHFSFGECAAMLIFLFRFVEGLAWAYQKRSSPGRDKPYSAKLHSAARRQFSSQQRTRDVG